MANETGLLIELPQSAIDAAQKFDKAMRNIQNAMVGVGKEFQDLGKGTKPLVEAINSLDRNVGAIAQKLGAIGNTGASAMDKVASAAKTTNAEVDKTVDKVTQLSSVLNKGLEGNKYAGMANGDLQKKLDSFEKLRDEMKGKGKGGMMTTKQQADLEGYNLEIAAIKQVMEYNKALASQRNTLLSSQNKKLYADDWNAEKAKEKAARAQSAADKAAERAAERASAQRAKNLELEAEAQSKLNKKVQELNALRSSAPTLGSKAKITQLADEANALLARGVQGNNRKGYAREIDELNFRMKEHIKTINDYVAAKKNQEVQDRKNAQAQSLAVATFNKRNVGLENYGFNAMKSLDQQGSARFSAVINEYINALDRYRTAANGSVNGNDRSGFQKQVQEAYQTVLRYKEELKLVAQEEGRVLTGGKPTSQASSAATLKNVAEVMREIQNASKNGWDNWKKNIPIAELQRFIDMINKALKSDLGADTKQSNGLAKIRQQLQDEVKERRKTTRQIQAEIQKQTEAEQRESEKRIAQARKEAEQKKQIAATSTQNAIALGNLAANGGGTGKWGTLEYQKKALGYLTEARQKLNPTDPKSASDLQRINELILQINRSIRSATNSSKELSQHHRNLLNYADQLARKFALVFSVSSLQGYFNKLVSIRGEMELQKRSLEAILQSRSQGDALFNKTVESALKSPFRIKELVTYTKQLAAYRIESDKLFDTTKRLADVSAGLGVDMQRLILAYGQVKAAEFLKGTEVRQFTEAGVNMYGELQKYFQEEKGMTYSIKEIVQMISDRKVVFEDVEAVIKRMTDAGGMFNKMQEKQSNTLKGKVGKLQDAIDMMYNSIGTEHETALKGMVDIAIMLTTHWEALALAGTALGAVFAIVKTQALLTSPALIRMATATNIAIKGTKGLSVIEGVALAFARLRKAVTSTSGVFTQFIGTNWQLIAAMMALSAAYAIYDKMDEWEKHTEENIKRHEEEIAHLNSLIKKFNDLRKAASDAAKEVSEAHEKMAKDAKEGTNLSTKEGGTLAFSPEVDDSSFTSIKEKMRGQYDSMLEELRKDGIDIENMNINIGNGQDKLTIPVSAVPDEHIEEAFDEVRKKAENFYNLVDRMRVSITANNDRVDLWGLLGEDLEDDSKDLRKELVGLSGTMSAYQNAVNAVAKNYDHLNNEAKKAFDTIREDPSKTGENQIVYLRRVEQQLVKIKKLTSSGDFGDVGKMFKEIDDNLSKGELDWSELFEFGGKTGSGVILKGASEEFAHELKEVVKTLNISAETDPVILQAAINKEAQEQEWTDWEKYIAENHVFHIQQVKIDEAAAEAEVDALKASLDDYFSHHPLKIGFSMGDIKTDVMKSQKDLIKEWQGVQQSAQETYDIFVNLSKLNALDRTEYAFGRLPENFKRAYIAMMLDADNLGRMTADQNKAYWKAVFEAESIDILFKGVWGGIDPKSIPSDSTAIDPKIGAQVSDVINQTAADIIRSLGGTVKTPKGSQTKKPKTTTKKGTGKGKGYKDDPTKALVEYYEMIYKAYQDLLDWNNEDDAFRRLYDTNTALGKSVESARVNAKAAKDIVPKLENINKLIAEAADKNWKGKADKTTEYQSAFKGISDRITEEENKKAKKNIEDAEKNANKLLKLLELREQLVKAGMSNSLVDITFADIYIPYDVADIRKKMESELAGISNGREGKEAADKILQQLRDHEIKSYEETTREVVKNYRQRLSDQAQLDGWYIQERDKIFSKNPETGKYAFDEETRRRMLNNLDDDYNKKFNKNLLESLKNSKAYEDMFSNLGDVSTKALDNILIKLTSVKDGLKGLNPTEMKEILKMEQDALVERVKRNPFDWGKLIKDVKAAGGDKTETQLESENMTSQAAIDKYEEENRVLEKLIAVKENKNGLDEEAQKIINENVELADKTVKELQDEINLNNDKIKTENATIAANQRAIAAKRTEREMYKAMADQIGQAMEKEKQLFKATRDLLEVMGVDEEDLLWADFGQSVLEGAMQTLQLLTNMKLVEAQAKQTGIAMNSMLGIIGYIAIVIETIVSIWSAFNKAHDAGLEKQIKRLQEQIEDLQESLEGLQQKFDDAFDTGSLVSYSNAIEKNIKAQIAAITAQINAERSKKDSDNDKIRDYQKQIRDLNEQVKELSVSMTESLGGIGSESNYKSAAQEFADAWYDAFKQGESGLDALNEKFDEVFDNLVKKQIMNRASLKFIKPILDMIDAAVAEDGEGGYDVTDNELAAIQSLKDSNLQGYNDYVSRLMEVLGINPDGSQLSALQQGISGVTEETASALEGIMESMRFYLATQQNDVAAIRSILENQYGTVDNNSPMLTELRAQTQLLTLMSTAFYNGGNGFGVRTYLQ